MGLCLNHPIDNVQSSALGALDTTLQELHNVCVLHGRTPTLPLLPLSRFISLRALTLCRVFDSIRRNSDLAELLCQLPVSLQARCCCRRCYVQHEELGRCACALGCASWCLELWDGG